MARSTTTNISIRMDKDLKDAADRLFSSLGMNISTAFNIFVRLSLREGGIPFMITSNVPNHETVAALNEYDDMKKHPDKYKRYDSFAELANEVLADD